MELRHLKYFLTVAETLNFSKAAEKLYISQPPLSRQIKELEQELGAKLFERNNKRVELTDAGRYFRAEVSEIFQRIEKAKLQTKKIAEHASGIFRIAYISSTFSGVISELIQHLSKCFPFVTFKLYEVPTPKQIVALEQGRLDLGILRAPLTSPKIKAEYWYSEGYSLVYRKNSLTLTNEADLRALKDETFVFFNKDYAPQYYDSLLSICAHYGFRPNLVHESNNVNSILQLVNNGLGVSIVPANMEAKHAYENLAFYQLKDVKLKTDVLLATGSELSEITNEAIKFLRSLSHPGTRFLE